MRGVRHVRPPGFRFDAGDRKRRDHRRRRRLLDHASWCPGRRSAGGTAVSMTAWTPAWAASGDSVTLTSAMQVRADGDSPVTATVNDAQGHRCRGWPYRSRGLRGRRSRHPRWSRTAPSGGDAARSAHARSESRFVGARLGCGRSGFDVGGLHRPRIEPVRRRSGAVFERPLSVRTGLPSRSSTLSGRAGQHGRQLRESSGGRHVWTKGGNDTVSSATAPRHLGATGDRSRSLRRESDHDHGELGACPAHGRLRRAWGGTPPASSESGRRRHS